jgi:hypothetical protein
MPIINVGLITLRDIFVLLPVNKDEQNQIVREFESCRSDCNKEAQSNSQALEIAEALWQSILKNAFGERLIRT